MHIHIYIYIYIYIYIKNPLFLLSFDVRLRTTVGKPDVIQEMDRGYTGGGISPPADHSTFGSPIFLKTSRHIEQTVFGCIWVLGASVLRHGPRKDISNIFSNVPSVSGHFSGLGSQCLWPLRDLQEDSGHRSRFGDRCCY